MDIEFDYAMVGEGQLFPYKSIDWIVESYQKGYIFKDENNKYWVKTKGKEPVSRLDHGDLIIYFDKELCIKRSIDIFDELITKRKVIGLL